MEQKNYSGKVIVNVQSATNLPNEDWGGASDPYVIVTLKEGDRQIYKVQTDTIMDNLNPIWKARILKHISGKTDKPLQFTFLINDEDDVGSDDFLGIVKYEFLPFDEFSDSVSLPVVDMKGKGGRGTLNFSISYFPDRLNQKLQEKSQLVYSFPEGKETKTVVGPILQFRGSDEKTYSVCILAVTQGEDEAGAGGATPLLEISPAPINNEVQVSKIFSFKDRHLWRYSFSVARDALGQSVNYSLNKKNFSFVVPGVNEPPRCLFMSCNGFHQDPDPPLADPYRMWKFINQFHTEGVSKAESSGYHLMIQGGDQVYADRVWNTVTALKGTEAGDEAGKNIEVDEIFKDEVETFYMDLYVNSWSEPLIAQALASIPSVMMWDDHDIFDGWGSYSNELLQSASYSMIYFFAEQYFCGFQLGATLEEINSRQLKTTLEGPHKGKSQGYLIDRTGIFSLDLRTERDKNTVCSKETYDCFLQWLEKNKEIDHLYLVLSIPIVYNNFDVLEQAISATGLGKELEDDLKDHWRTSDHSSERLMLIKLLVEAAEKYKFRITILSGDVHIGCAGVIYDKNRKRKSNAAIINCLISSAVVNVPPPPSVVQVLELTGGEIERVPQGDDAGWNLKTGLYRFHHDSRKERYVPGRNFLELVSDHQKGIMCKWYSEKQEGNPYELYIYGYRESYWNDLPLRPDDSKYLTQGVLKLITLPLTTVQGWFT